jgi:hypothetical protein
MPSNHLSSKLDNLKLKTKPVIACDIGDTFSTRFECVSAFSHSFRVCVSTFSTLVSSLFPHLPHSFRVYFYIFSTFFECISTSSPLVSSVVLDEVVVQYLLGYCEYYNKLKNTNFKPSDFFSYSFYEAKFTLVSSVED